MGGRHPKDMADRELADHCREVIWDDNADRSDQFAAVITVLENPQLYRKDTVNRAYRLGYEIRNDWGECPPILASVLE